MAGLIIRKGDRLPVFERTIKVDEEAIDLTSATDPKVIIASTVDGSETVEPITIIDAAAGSIRWEPSTSIADLTPGIYAVWFQVTIDGKTLTSPNDGFETLTLVDGLSGVATYTGDPAARPLDAVRFTVGDTNMANPQLTDTEIEWLLDNVGGSTMRAAIYAVRTMMSRATRVATVKRVGPLSVSKQGQIDDLKALLEMLERQLMEVGPAVPYAGGQSRQEREADRSDRDMVQPHFRRGQHDDRGSSTYRDYDELDRELP